MNVSIVFKFITMGGNVFVLDLFHWRQRKAFIGSFKIERSILGFSNITIRALDIAKYSSIKIEALSSKATPISTIKNVTVSIEFYFC